MELGTSLKASLCSLERVVRPPPTEGPLDRRNWRRGLRRGNDGHFRREGMIGADDLPKGKTRRRNGPSENGRVLARTRNRLATGNEGNGNTLTSGEPCPGATGCRA